LPDKKIPIFSKVAKDWLEYKKPNVRESTWVGYEGHLKHHFQDVNSIRINRITIAKVEKFIADKQTKGMNLATLRKIIVTFNQVMSYAVRHKYIDYNPVRDAERPKSQGTEKKEQIRILTPSEIKAFLEVEAELKYKTLFMMAIFSGARQGELLGLKWTDIDWFNNQAHIQRTFNKGKWYRPKSKNSDRKIDLGPSMMAELKRWRIACPKSELDLVFPNRASQPINQANMLNRHFFPALKAAKIPRIRFHDLRHTYASLLIDQGENIKYIQNQLGHSSPIVTLEVYAHIMNPVNQKSARRLENTIFGTSGSKMVAEIKKGFRHES
jgi:integrase